MALNGVRSLTMVQQQGWEAYVDAVARNISIVDVPTQIDLIEQVKKWTVRFTYLDLALGSFGILYALVAIGFLSETPIARAYIVVSLLIVFSCGHSPSLPTGPCASSDGGLKRRPSDRGKHIFLEAVPQSHSERSHLFFLSFLRTRIGSVWFS